MATRRQILRAAGVGLGAGLGFCGCCLRPTPARAANPVLPKIPVPVRINGNRVPTIDVHGHCYFQDALDLMGDEKPKILPPVKGVPEHFLAKADVMQTRLATLDAMGIDMQVQSINPYWYARYRATASRIVELNNSHLAEMHAAHPDRLQAFAGLTMQFPDLAVAQLDDAVRNKKLVGAAIGSNMLGESFADPKYDPVWAKAEALGAVLFIHPISDPLFSKRMSGNGWLSNVIGNPLDTTICLQHFIFEGVLDRFPGLKLLAAHGGGYIGDSGDRAEMACFVSPQNCNPNIVLKKSPGEYRHQIHVDALVFTTEALRHLVASMGASQVMLGTDCPIPWETHPVDQVMATASLSDAEKIAILGGNASRLLKTKV